MPNEAPLLTIAIPTYNRECMLNELLSVLEAQVGNGIRVELLVSDNASQDGTASVVAAHQARGAKIRYIRNDSNVGADRNILQCYLQAAGEYVWILSDDDLIEPDTIPRILTALSKRQYDIICIRGYPFEGEYAGPRSKESKPDLEFDKPEELARHIHVFFTFISSVIVNKQRNSVKPHRSFESLVGTNLVQLGPFYTALNQHRRSLLIRDRLIAARGNSSVGYPLYRVFGPTFAGITREWIEQKRTQRAILRGTIRKFFPFWLFMSRKSLASRIKEDPHAVLRECFGSDLRYWLFNYPIYALPFPLARGWMFGVRAFNKIDNILLDLR
jgi:glycosyltransferase involved in cell wall biosynthesis